MENITMDNMSASNTSQTVFYPLVKQPVYMVIILSLAYGTVFCTALIGNLSVIAVIYRDKRFHSVTYVLLVNLAIADVMVALFCLPITLMTNIFNGHSLTNIALHKRAIHKSTGWADTADRAVDGDTNNDKWAGSCSYSTNSGGVLDGPWWAVDLGAFYDISHVVISSCDQYRISFKIHLEMYMASPFHCGTDNPRLCSTESNLPLSKNITCAPGATGRFLLIRSHGINPLCLCEVEVYAAGGSCPPFKMVPFQKVDKGLATTYDYVTLVASKTAVDCIVKCSQAGPCNAVSFNAALEECAFVAGFEKFLPITTVSGSVVYKNC